MLAVWYPTELLEPSTTSWVACGILAGVLVGFLLGCFVRKGR